MENKNYLKGMEQLEIMYGREYGDKSLKLIKFLLEDEGITDTQFLTGIKRLLKTHSGFPPVAADIIKIIQGKDKETLEVNKINKINFVNKMVAAIRMYASKIKPNVTHEQLHWIKKNIKNITGREYTIWDVNMGSYKLDYAFEKSAVDYINLYYEDIPKTEKEVKEIENNIRRLG